jgi:hypothetical protein
MTPLALALVACCAMVCGTRLALRRYDVREAEAHAATRDASGAAARVSTCEASVTHAVHELSALRAEVDSLRASAAFRSM